MVLQVDEPGKHRVGDRHGEHVGCGSVCMQCSERGPLAPGSLGQRLPGAAGCGEVRANRYGVFMGLTRMCDDGSRTLRM